jgi:hypothetical protein
MASSSATVGAGGHQHDNVVQIDRARDLFQDRLEHRTTRLRPRAVAYGYRDPRPGRDDVTKSWPFHRGPQGFPHGSQLVGHAKALLRSDEGGACGKLDSEL